MLPHLNFHDWVLLIGGMILGTALHFAGDTSNKGGGKPRDVPLPSIAAGPACPAGWKDTSVLTLSVRAYTCERGDWAVVLTEQGVCDRGRRMNPPEAKWSACSEVPGWPGN